jgi:putative membrane protein
VDHVIGWNYRATWFQRRAGLTTMVATTAGGSQAVPILDIPEHLAVELSERALPDLVTQFRA